jgi:hypothetical protein
MPKTKKVSKGPPLRRKIDGKYFWFIQNFRNKTIAELEASSFRRYGTARVIREFGQWSVYAGPRKKRRGKKRRK